MHLFGISVVAIALLIPGKCCSQRVKRIGVDIVKLLPIVYKQGIVVEPFARVAIVDKVDVVVAGGAVDVFFGKVYNNLEYYNRGLYGKVGASYSLVDELRLGFGFVYSSFTETGKAHLKGDYHGPLDIRLIQHQRLFGVEQFLEYPVDLSARWGLELQGRFAVVLNDFNEPNFGTYYSPGFGLTQFRENSEDADGASRFAFGVSVRIGYKL